jgi:hypothetical protein
VIVFIVSLFVPNLEISAYYSLFTIYHSLFFVYTNHSLPEELLEAIESANVLRIFEAGIEACARQIF